uniref:Uncharacterized protein n=1 Tax=Anopheles merus TaxID=30066 RepID=A0A182VE86_ANOME
MVMLEKRPGVQTIVRYLPVGTLGKKRQKFRIIHPLRQQVDLVQREERKRSVVHLQAGGFRFILSRCCLNALGSLLLSAAEWRSDRRKKTWHVCRRLLYRPRVSGFRVMLEGTAAASGWRWRCSRCCCCCWSRTGVRRLGVRVLRPSRKSVLFRLANVISSCSACLSSLLLFFQLK